MLLDRPIPGCLLAPHLDRRTDSRNQRDSCKGRYVILGIEILKRVARQGPFSPPMVNPVAADSVDEPTKSTPIAVKCVVSPSITDLVDTLLRILAFRPSLKTNLSNRLIFFGRRPRIRSVNRDDRRGAWYNVPLHLPHSPCRGGLQIHSQPGTK